MFSQPYLLLYSKNYTETPQMAHSAFNFPGFTSGKNTATTPINGSQVLTWKINSILVMSASQPKKAEPMPPKPNIKPKKIPAIIPTLSGIKSVAYTTIAEKAEAITNPVITAITKVPNKFK